MFGNRIEIIGKHLLAFNAKNTVYMFHYNEPKRRIENEYYNFCI